jgi:3-methyladenine DNA glycosylase AlkD
MTSKEVLSQLQKMGSAQIKSILLKHGASEPIYGVRIGDMKPIIKKVKKDYQLSMDLYNSGVYDAMYLAGLIADEDKMSKKEIQQWAEKSNCGGISEYTVAWVAAESTHGWELGLEWIESPKERIASSGWSALAGWISMKPDEELDIKKIRALLKRIQKEIHKAPNRVRYVMNNFVIVTGSYVKELTEECKEIGKAIGPVMVDMGDTACEVPSIEKYIDKVKAKGTIGKKKKTVKC